MNLEDLSRHFTGKAIEEATDLNPLSVAEVQESRRSFSTHSSHYTVRAIDIVVSRELNFASTCNSLCDLAERYISVLCPKCGKALSAKNGGGNSEVCSIEFSCDCGTTTTLTMPWDAFSCQFPKAESDTK